MGRVRRAEPSDASGIGRVHVAAWRAAYRGKMPDSYLAGLDPAQSAEGWGRLLAEGPGGGRVMFGADPATVLVTEDDDGRIVGICSFGSERGTATEGAPARVGELMMINFEPASWGSGLARQTMAAALEELTAQGFEEAVLWVLDSNARARRFYEREGWAPDGGEKQDERLGFELHEVRYRRRLRREGSASGSPPP